MADRRGIVIPLIVLAFIFLTPNPAQLSVDQARIGRTLEDAIEEEQRSLAQLQNSTYRDDGVGHLNLTGFGVESGFAWDALPLVRGLARKQREYAFGEWENRAVHSGDGAEEEMPLYQNITGLVHGRWVRSQIQELPTPHLNLSHYGLPDAAGGLVSQAFDRNVTGEQGDMKMRFHHRHASSASFLDAAVHGNVTNLDLEMTFTDRSTEYDLRLIGVYFPVTGEAVLTTTSQKFAGIFALPHLTTSERMFEQSRALLNESISRVIQRQMDGSTERLNPWSPTFEDPNEISDPTPACEMVVYLQQLTPATSASTPITSPLLSFLEQELRFPTGAFIPQTPEMRFSMLLFSPDCGYLLESDGPPNSFPIGTAHLSGPKVEVTYNQGRNHLLLFATTLSLQLWLFMRQMRESSTPSTRSRISLYTIAILALGDGFTFMAFLLVSFFVGGVWVTLMFTAFLAFVSVSFFGMRFMMDIWNVQAPEREARRREEAEEIHRRERVYIDVRNRLIRERQARLARQTGTARGGEVAVASATLNNGVDAVSDTSPPLPGAADAIAPLSTEDVPDTDSRQPLLTQPIADSLPLPVTAQRPIDTGATPVFMPSDQAGLEPITSQPGVSNPQITRPTPPRESFGSVYTKFYLLLLFTLFLTLNATSWPTALRKFYFNFLGVVYLSFWLPQIYRNVQRNCRKALHWEFVLGQSVLRLVPFVYFYGYGGNVLFVEPDYGSLGVFAAYLALEVLVLGSQELVGPRWFVGKAWLEPAYDYHPVLREDEEDATMPIGFSQVAPGSPVAEHSQMEPRGSRSDSGSATSRPLQRSRQNSRRNSASAKETRSKGKRVFDCAICMQELEVPVLRREFSDGGGGGQGGRGEGGNLTGPLGLLARRAYMITPCRHVFHSGCLEGWMKFRLVCPVCREGLPPL